MTAADDGRLADQHTPEAIEARLKASTDHSYLGDGVLGAVDGTVTTFAIVAGATGAELGAGIALVLGLANVVADGFSMAVGNYMKAKSDRQVIERARRMEERHIDQIPEGEREEVRQIFLRKGFDGETLEEIVQVITHDRKRWVDTMLTEELGLRLETPSPAWAGLTTFVAFFVAGLIPLLPLIVIGHGAFVVSAAATVVTFFGIGVVKGRLLGESPLAHGVEALIIGVGAATLAYVVGVLARGLAH